MRVKVLFFGVLREMAGRPEREAVLDEHATVQDVIAECERLLPGTAIWPSIAAAVNQEYALRSHELQEGDVVALLPPVSGGCFLRVLSCFSGCCRSHTAGPSELDPVNS